MKDTTKIFLGLGIGVVLIVGGIIIYQNNRPKPKPHPDAEEDEYMTDDAEEVKEEAQTSADGQLPPDDSELGLLQRRVALMEVRDQFKDPNVAGYEEYMEKTKAAIEETHKKKLVFYQDEEKYVIGDFQGNVKGVIKKSA